MTHYLFHYLCGQTGESVHMSRPSLQGVAAQRRWFVRRHPQATLISVAVDGTRKILDEVLAENGRAYERLKAKCRHEGASLRSVILSHGDPRTWA